MKTNKLTSLAMNVTFDITRDGGQLGKVKFRLGRQIVEPFSTAPWCDKPGAAKLIPLLRELRGDFFCAPFGAGPARRGEAHPPHGEPANGTWKVLSSEPGRLVATLRTRVRPGKITKIIEARESETNIYQTHLLEDFQGRMCLGHHAMLGVEDVTAYFHLGLAASLADNPWKEKGAPTSVALTKSKGTRIPYIMGIAPLSAGFDSVRSIQRAATGIRLTAASGAHIDHAVDTTFIQ